jgi:hypothetical protein
VKAGQNLYAEGVTGLVSSMMVENGFPWTQPAGKSGGESDKGQGLYIESGEMFCTLLKV